ncbi:hypothetical protein F5X68DRAFT_243682 [Plectosphaerella plurivora]|uniref:Uncharacterized protein n=1 Tax=Plectosphaerella plurivora TaxID=936078 RepID=A0A9P8VKG8_9PEZI|nr:hypothetical protein F5X68DRAFT_243682 [Plectosphaerella plurivora]
MSGLSTWAMQPLAPALLVICCSVAFFAIRAMTKSCHRPASETSVRGSKALKPPEKPVKHIEPLANFDYEATQRHEFRPFKPIFHITMALQSDTPSDLITIDQDYLSRINIRKALIDEHPNRVHGCVPAGVDAVHELHQYLFHEYLPVRYPTIFQQVDGERGRMLRNSITGMDHPTAVQEDSMAALLALGTSVEEDLFLLKPTPDGHQCVAFMCCFPSGWDPAEKLGRHMKQIHATVPGYEKIGPSMERFFGKLEAGKSVKRQNWTVQTHANLYAAKGNHIHGEEDVQEEEIDIEKTFLRVELQTLSRLPKTHSILFSFKTFLYPIKDLKQEGLGPRLADAIEGLRKGNTPGMWRYKMILE